MGLATAAWMEPYWGGAYYHPAYWGGYPCCASASANVYGHWGNAAYSGTRSWYAGGGVAGTTASGSYYNSRTGTSGSYNAGRQYNAWTGNATRGYDRTANGAARRLGQRCARRQLQHLHRPALDRSSGVGNGRRRQLLQPRRRDDGGTAGRRSRRRRLDVQRQDRQDQHLGHGEPSATITTPTSTATSTRTTAAAGSSTRRAAGAVHPATRRGQTANRRRAAHGEDRWGGFSSSNHSFGGGGFGGGGFRGGGGWGGRFGGGGFGGGGFRGGGFGGRR